jgi:carbon-monoxide dehydrogenase large subunit
MTLDKEARMNAISHVARLPQAEMDRIRKVTGAGRYTADERFDGTLRAVFVRSPYAHARILAVDIVAASAMDGVLAVIVGSDCVKAGLGNFPVIDRIGTGLVIPHRPILAADEVRHIGEAVAMVIAETQAQALDAAEAVLVEYEGLDAVIGIAAALAEGAALVHPAAAGNVALHHQNGDADAVAQAFADAAQVIETTIEMPRLAPVTLEPRAAVGVWNDADGRYELRAPHQGVNEMRRDLAAVFKLPADRFHVLGGDVGGGFGPRNIAYPEYAALLMGARLVGKPVAWHGTRTESFLTDIQGRGVRVSGRLALDASHRFLALSMQYDADLGAYISPVAAFAAVHNPLQSVVGCYAIAHTHASFRLLHTHTVPTGPYRGAGRPEMALLIERLVDIASRTLGVDPFELRARNAIPSAAFPYTLPSGARYDSGDFLELMRVARTRSAWDGFAARQAAALERGIVLGRGMALFVEVSGGGGAPDEAALTLSAEGGAACLRIETVTASTGQSHARTFANIATPRLGLAEIDVILVASDPDTRLSGAGSYASRSTIAAGSAVAQAADEISRLVRGLAALRANCGADELSLVDGHVQHADGRTVCSIASLLAEPISVVGKVAPTNAYASGCHVVEVEVDRATGTVALTRYVAVDDGGVIIDHQAADAQIHGGIAQGVGEVLGEDSVSDANGQMIAASLMDYALPRFGDFPSLEVIGCNVPSPFNPLGVKGIGEAGTTGALCAVTSAVFDVLGGRDLPAMPFTAERVWATLAAV